jgi:hypothetical protein
MTEGNERLRGLIAELREDFPSYAERCLKIRPEGGSVSLNPIRRPSGCYGRCQH